MAQERTKILTLDNVDIYEDDLEFFQIGNWFNDSCLHYCFKRYEAKLNEDILLLDPSVASFLKFQCQDDEEFDEFIEGVKLPLRKWIFLPLNNAKSLFVNGTHWSLLICDVERGNLYHLDSGGCNTASAAASITYLSRLLKRTLSVPVQISCPQQRNAYDCGPYTALFAIRISQLLNSSTTDLDPSDFPNHFEIAVQDVTGTEINSFRTEVYVEICRAAEESLSNT